MHRIVAILTLAGAVLMPQTAKAAPDSLQIYFVDVEGGQATLVVTPAGKSLLIDTGWPGFNSRDADRIAAAAKDAGVTQIDYLLITHYHRDHVGGVAQLAQRMKIGTFVDHGPNLENAAVTREDYAAYLKQLKGHPHLVAKAGDRIPVPGLEVRALSSGGNTVPGTGHLPKNPLCAAEPDPTADPTENARSLGVMITLGKFRFLDLGDLTRKKELALACPANLVGTVDLFLVTHHGGDSSNPKALVWAMQPRVAVINNGPRKGAAPAAWQTVHDAPGLQDLWQLHYAMEGGRDHNAPEGHIANLEEKCSGKFIQATAKADGSFVVRNSRTGKQKTYAPR
jgi:beta-lactamase superfamily II metal-dependent hydrolase